MREVFPKKMTVFLPTSFRTRGQVFYFPWLEVQFMGRYGLLLINSVMVSYVEQVGCYCIFILEHDPDSIVN